jgi:two-component system KDP operon response regulator KdpE
VTALLIVDGDVQVQRALTRVFSAERFDCVVARTIDEALERVRESAPAIVLMDVALGAESGIELQRLLRAAHPRRPAVVFITGRRDLFGDLAQELGPADDWVTKPWDAAELTSRVRLAIRRAGNPAPF